MSQTHQFGIALALFIIPYALIILLRPRKNEKVLQELFVLGGCAFAAQVSLKLGLVLIDPPEHVASFVDEIRLQLGMSMVASIYLMFSTAKDAYLRHFDCPEK